MELVARSKRAKPNRIGTRQCTLPAAYPFSASLDFHGKELA